MCPILGSGNFMVDMYDDDEDNGFKSVFGHKLCQCCFECEIYGESIACAECLKILQELENQKDSVV